MEVLMLGMDHMDVDKRHPQGSCDWKDWCTAWEDVKTMIAHFAIKLPDIAYEEVETKTYHCDGGEAVSRMFRIVDYHLLPLGYQIVQYDTGGDFYVFQVIPEADWPGKTITEIIREEMGYV